MHHRQRLPVLAAAMLVSASLLPLSLPVGSPAVANAAPACNLVPQLRAVTLNQGLGSYANLARGKETLVRLFLSLPSCAASGASIALTGGTLTILNGTATLGTITAPTPVPAQTPAQPLMTPYASAPALDSTADPKFVVPAAVLAPTNSTGQFTASFRATVGYSAKASKTGTAVTGTTTFTTLTGSSAPITATVQKLTNALRILVVPMGDASKSYASQFSAGATTAVQNAMTTLSRTWPVPAGVADLGATTGGLRYTINPTLLNIGQFMTTGSFCGGAGSFDAIKGLLAQYLLSWNTANPTRTADIVLGAVDSAISTGSSNGCAEGMASVNSPQAWIRAIPDGSSPSMSGGLASMEIAHTLGVEPLARDDAFSPYHSPNLAADGTAPGRGYNVTLRSYLAAPKTAMTLSTGWNNTTVLYEPADWGQLLCALGGATTTDCQTSGVVGTSTGVAAGPRFVISGTTDGTTGGTNVVESYFSLDVAPTRPDPASSIHLLQVSGNVILSDLGIPTSSTLSDHDAAGPQTEPSDKVLFSASLAFNTLADRIRLVKHSPSALDVILYERTRNPNGAPSITGLGTGPTPFAVRNFSNDPAKNDTSPSLSSDGKWITWVVPCSKVGVGCPPGPADPWRILLGPTSDVSLAEPIGVAVGTETENYTDPALIGSETTGLKIAFARGSTDPSLYSAVVGFLPPLAPGGPNRPAVPSTNEQLVVSGAGAAPDISEPTWSPDGSQIAYTGESGSETGPNIYVVDDAPGATPTQVTFSDDASEPSWSRTPGVNRISYTRTNFSIGLTTPLVPPARGLPVAPLNQPVYAAPVAPAIAPGGRLDAPTIYVVTDAADPGDGTCDSSCTLRDAILAANGNVGADTIDFAISGAGVHTIQPSAVLPPITEQVTIDGTTQTGTSGCSTLVSPLIELSGAGVSGTPTGLRVQSGGTIIDGLIVNRWAGNGIQFAAGTGSRVECSYIGTDPTGTVARPNVFGVYDSAGGNTIGASAPGAGNVISGNSSGARADGTGSAILGNRIGTNAAGTAAVPNSDGVVVIGGATVGGTAGGGNVISGNTQVGINVAGGSGATIIDNVIGLNAGSTAAIPNGAGGILVQLSSSNVTIGSTFGGNVVAGNGGAPQAQIQVQNATNVTILGNRVGGTGFASPGVGIRVQNTNGVVIGTDAVTSDGNRVTNNGGGGIVLTGTISGANSIKGNVITNNTGPGLSLQTGVSNVVIGDTTPVGYNTITGNTAQGVLIDGGTGNAVRGNRINANGALGIDLIPIGVTPNDALDADAGSNQLQNFPIITSVLNSGAGTISGTLSSAANTTYAVDLYASPACDASGFGEGALLVDLASPVSVTTDGTGSAPWFATPLSVITTGVVTATATDPGQNTSEFSPCTAPSAGGSPSADLSLSSVVTPTTGPTVGELVTVSATIANAGPSTATSVTLDATIPAELTYLGASGGTCNLDTDLLCNLSLPIPNGTSSVVTLRFRSGLVGPWTLPLQVSATEPDPVPSNDSTSAVGTIDAPCGPAVTECIWTLDPAVVENDRRLFLDGAYESDFGAGGDLTFGTVTGISKAAWNDGAHGPVVPITTDSSDLYPSTGGALTAFTRAFSPSFQTDVMIYDPLPGQLVHATATIPPGTDPASIRADVLLMCGAGTGGGASYLVAVGVSPTAFTGTATTGGTASFDQRFDPTLSCAGGKITVLVSDGFLRSTPVDALTTTVGSDPKPPVAAIYGPPNGSSRLQWDIIPLRGSGKDAEDGELTGSRLTWLVTGPGGSPTRTATGVAADLAVPSNGWPAGIYTAVLTAADSTNRTGAASTTFTILADADNDGIPAGSDTSACGGGTSLDNDPSNAFGDLDGDGIPNASDPAPCIAATSYLATVTFDPQSLYVPSNGTSVTMYASILGRDMRAVNGASVILDRVGGEDPNAPTVARCRVVGGLKATSYSPTASQATIKFDRQKLNGFLTCMGFTNRSVDLRISGAAAGAIPAWTWSGITFVVVKS